jgi:hypothetical protein
VTFASGAAVGVLLFAFPLAFHWDAYSSGITSVFTTQTSAAVIQPPLFDLVAVHDPIIALVALIALPFSRRIGPLVALGFAVTLAYQTMMYPPRIMYFLPYLLAVIAAAAASVWDNDKPALGKAIMQRALALLLLWNVVVVLLVRPVIACHQKSAASAGQMAQGLSDAIGAGPHRVLVEEWSAYYVARNLGWKIYRSGSLVNKKDYLEFIESMDFIVVRENPLFGITPDMARDAGFDLLTKLQFPQYPDSRISWGPVHIPVPSHGYAPLFIYKNGVMQP